MGEIYVNEYTVSIVKSCKEHSPSESVGGEGQAKDQHYSNPYQTNMATTDQRIILLAPELQILQQVSSCELGLQLAAF